MINLYGQLLHIPEVVVLSDRPGDFQERRPVEQPIRSLPQSAPRSNFINDTGVSDGLKREIQKVQLDCLCMIM